MPKRLSAPPIMPTKSASQALKPKTDLSQLLTSSDIQKQQSQRSPLRYLTGYPAELIDKIATLVDNKKLGEHFLQRYPTVHDIKTDKALYELAMSYKHNFMRQSDPLSKVIFDDKINLSHHALGLHTYANRRQGHKVKAKNEIRISSRLKHIPLALLQMVVVHELAHLREKEHNKAFYQLCTFMLADYHQLEFDMRVWLVAEEVGLSPY
ncbi:YgjP-like metallopeptidase domain-containing protein [Shewanella gaetbuli]